jgi:VWFA-related protein
MRIHRLSPILVLAVAMAQTPAGPTVIRTETRMVLVDAVVTDKSGTAVRDLTAKDFHVWEDGKEQVIRSAAFVADPSTADALRSYLVLFFDNASLDLATQDRARDAAVQYIDAYAGPNRYVAIVNYGGAISISQNFTTDVERLKRIAADPHVGAALGRANLDPNTPSMGNAARIQAQATASSAGEGFAKGLRLLALNLAGVPGRKSVVVFSAGFPLSSQLSAQLNSAVEACNQSDVVLYPVYVNGLAQGAAPLSLDSIMTSGRGGRGRNNAQPASGDTGVAPPTQGLDALAARTGGYVYSNANSLFAGLMKIGREQNEYYLLGYTPVESPEGSCHPLKVKVDRGGAVVRARASYCNVKGVDLLAGKPVERELEYRVTGNDPGNVAASMQVPFFYTEADTARLNVAMEIPAGSLHFEKAKGKSHAELNIVGIAYLPDGSAAARFSDTVKLDFATQKELDAFRARPLHYEKEFFAAPGTYRFKVAFSSGGEGFGKLEAPLTIQPYDGKEFMLSGLALSKEVHPVSDLGTAQDAELLEGRTPLVYKDAKIVPAGTNRFARTDPVALYGEVYEPLLAGAAPPIVELRMRIVDNAGAVKSTGAMRPVIVANSGSAVLPFALKLKVDGLTAGAYRADVEAVDSAGKTMLRSVDFEIK